MANDLNFNPIKIDTGGTIFATGAGSGQLRIRQIRLTSATAAGTAVVTDGADKEIARLTAATATNAQDSTVDFGIDGLVVNGLKVSGLPTGGVLHIYCK